MDNLPYCSIFTQLTVNSLQGDRQLVRWDMPQPTKGSGSEGTSTDFFCWLEAVSAPMVMLLRVAMANGRPRPGGSPVPVQHNSQRVFANSVEDLWGGSPFSALPKVLPGPTGIQRAGAHLCLPRGNSQACPCSRDAWETRQNSCWEQPTSSIF